jgi:hypothetical protein
MGSAQVMKGRPVPNPLLEQKLNMTNKLRPKFTVAQIQETAEIRRIRVAPKETVLHPRMQNLMFDFRVHRGSPHPKRWVKYFLTRYEYAAWDILLQAADYKVMT